MRILSLFLSAIFVLIPLASYGGDTSPFSDISPNHINYDAVKYLYDKGVIGGYADGTYKPEKPVNRVEALKILILGAGIDLSNIQISLNFKDTNPNAWYATYLSIGQNLGIVKGYDDGTFKPSNTVNLAETLKMLIETNNATYDKIVQNAPYDDVPSNSWFSAYFQFAKENKLLDTPGNGIISPAKDINRADFAEIIYRYMIDRKKEENNKIADQYPDTSEGQQLSSGEKYSKNELTASHRTFAMGSRVKVTNINNGKSVIVTINDNNIDNPDREIRLSQKAFNAIAPVNIKILQVKIEKIEGDVKIQDEIIKTEDTCKYPSDRNKIKQDFFAGIKLNKEIEGTMRENEIYDISGSVGKEIKEVTAFVIDEKGNKSVFNGTANNGFFSLEIDSGSPGEKQIGIITGKSGTSYLGNIDVYKVDCEKKHEKTYQITPDNLSYKIKDNEVFFKWNGTGSLIRLVVKQGNNQVIKYLIRNDNYIKAESVWFKNFSEGEGYFQVSLASSSSSNSFDQNTKWAVSQNKKINIVKHHRSFNNNDTIESNNIPSSYSFGGEILFSGNAKNDIKTESDIILPNNKVESIKFTSNKQNIKDKNGTEVFPSSSKFNFSYKPKEHGTYIIEINNSSGMAGLNFPVYEDSYVPLIPDYRDLAENIEKIKDINVNNLRSKLVGLINEDRSLVGLDRIMLNPSLNELAQERANDMAKNNYISHWNLEGKSINDIKFNFGIKNILSENIAKEVNLEFSHYGLMRSASHRKNILDNDWTRGGFGFAIGKDGLLITVEVFSASPIKETDINSMREEIINVVNSKRSSLLVPSSVLHAVAQNWSNTMVEGDFFDFSGKVMVNGQETTIKFNDEIINAGIESDAGSLIMEHSSWKGALDEIKNHEKIFDNIWKKIGIGIKQDENGIIKITAIYTR